MRILYFKTFSALLMMIFASLSFAEPDMDYLKHAAQVSAQFNEMAAEITETSNSQAAHFRQMASEIAGRASDKAELKEKASKAPADSTLVFVTWAMGEPVLKELVNKSIVDPSIQLIFRGVLPNEKLVDGLIRMKRLYGNSDSAASMVINPVLFRKFNVGESAPVVITTDQSGNEKSRIAGAYNIDWVREKFLNRDDDYGIVGDLVKVSELDMIKVMKQQASQIDWEEKKNAAIKRVWTNQVFSKLPPAKQDGSFDVDLTVVAARDIIAPDGTIVIRKDTRINPLDIKPFTHTLVIFNPERPEEMKKILELKQAGELTKPIFMMTDMDQDRGWDRYGEILDAIDDEVFILTSEIKQRFHIRNTPSLVKQSKHGRTVTRYEMAVIEK